MFAVEFRATIKNGMIEVPEVYRKSLKSSVKVIILTEEKPESSIDMIDQLLNNPIKMNDFKPIKRDDIYDR